MPGSSREPSELPAPAAYARTAASQTDSAVAWPASGEDGTMSEITALSGTTAHDTQATSSRAMTNEDLALQEMSSCGAVGAKKRRPIVEVALPRPRTSSNQADTSWDQSQSPTKKQRTESTDVPIQSLDRSSAPLPALGNKDGDTSVIATHTSIHSATNISSSQDSQVASATQGFSNMSTTTPSAPAHHATPQDPLLTKSSTSSKHTSPTISNRQRSTPVVEIPFKVVSLSGSTASNSLKEEEHATTAIQTLSARTNPSTSSGAEAEPSDVDVDPHTDSAELACNTTRDVSPELEDTSPKKARSRRASPILIDQDSSADIHPSRLSEGPEASTINGQELVDLERGKRPLATSGVLEKDAPDWRGRGTRGVTRPQISYDEGTDSEEEEDVESPRQVLPARRVQKAKDRKMPTLKQPRSAQMSLSASGSDFSASATSATLPTAEPRSKIPLKRKPNQASKPDTIVLSDGASYSKAAAAIARRPLVKSKSEGTLAFGKGKGKGKVLVSKRRGSDSSSEGEVLFGTPKTSPAKKAKAGKQRPAKAPYKAQGGAPQKPIVTARSRTPASDTDGSLPSLPTISSQGPTAIQVRRPFDIFDLEENVFVTIKARLKPSAGSDSQETNVRSPASVSYNNDPLFWWPARIENRNRNKFTVSVVVDQPEESILSFCEPVIVIPNEDLREERIRNLQDIYTHEIPFPSPAKAYHNILSHPLRDQYTMPTEAAFKSALRLSRRIAGKEFEEAVANSPAGRKKSKVKEARPSGLTPGKGSPKPRKSTGRKGQKKKADAYSELSDSETSGSEVERIRAATKAHIGSDSGDLDSDIEIDTACLAKDGNAYWPCRVIAIGESAPVVGPPNRRRRPYQIEFYPKLARWVERKILVLKEEPQFYIVPIGELQRSDKQKGVLIPDDHLLEVLPAMAELTLGAYEPGRQRHRWFFSEDPKERSYVARVAVYGQFEEDQIKQLSDYLSNWLFGKIQTDIAVPDQAFVNTLNDDIRKLEYVVQVLLPTALELIYINDDDTIEQRAIAHLQRQNSSDPTPEQVRLYVHKLAAKEMSESTTWWESLLNLRKAQDDREFMRQKMATQLDEDDIRAMGLEVGRKRKTLNYKE